jgi:cytosine/creatinine deaminase
LRVPGVFLKDHRVRVTVLDLPECITLMDDFIRNRPDLWKEDIGEV